MRVRGAQAGRAFLGLLPLVLPPAVSRSPEPGGNLSRSFVFCSPQPGPVLPSHMLLHKLLCCPLLLFPHPPPFCVHRLPYRHTVPLSSPVPFPGPLVSR